jgi:hypothetical protein
MAAPPAPHNSLNLFFFKYYKSVRMNQQPVFVMAPRQSGGGGGLALLLMMLLLLFVIVVTIVAIVIIRRRKMKSETKNTRSKIRDHRNKLYEGAEGVGINKEDVDEIILNKSNLMCLVYPNEDGVCDTRFYDLREGCCKLKSDAEEVAGLQRQEMMSDILMEVGVLLVAEVIVTSVLPRIGSRIAKYSSKALAKITARAAQAMAAKLALKMTQFASRMLIKLGSGPVGWALLVFEMISLTMDLADLRNYDSFIENKTNMEMRDLMVYKFYEAITLSGGEYPVLFPYSLLFPEASETVSADMTGQMIADYMDELLEIDGGLEYMTDLLMKALDAEDDGTDVISETPDEQTDGLGVIDTWISNVRKKHAVELDKKTFDALQAKIPESRRNDIFLVPSMSSESTIGISITEDAANRWNEEKKAEWFTYLDPFFPPNTPEADWVPPFTAIYTNRYLKTNLSNPGTLNAPNLVYDSLPRKVTLAYPFGPLVSNCEKPRTSAKYKESIDPKQFGVKFNYENGVCEYTRDYCDRYVIDYKTKTWKDTTPYTDCELTGDQRWAEAFLGTNIVRDAKRYWDDPAQIPADLEQLYEDRRNKHGPVAGTMLMVVDPLGFSEQGAGFVDGIKEKMRGKDRYCLTGDTCKFFTAKHDGGNFMTWSVRNADGQLYPHPLLGTQGQVKIAEDHTFYVPEGGQFRIKCDPGDGKNYSYDEITDNETKKFTCWNGKVNKPFNPIDTVAAAGDAVVDAVTSVSVSADDGNLAVDSAVGGASVGTGGVVVDTVVGGGSITDEGVAVDSLLGGASVGTGGVVVDTVIGGGSITDEGVSVSTPVGGISVGSGGISFEEPSGCTIM